MSDSVRQWSPSRSGGIPGSANRGSQGASGTVAVVFAAFVAVFGGLVSLVTTHHLGVMFSVLFVIGCAASALLVRRTGALAVVVAPPLLYVVIAGILSQFARSTDTNSGLVHRSFAVVDQLVTGAPTIWIATALAALIVVIRRRRVAAA